MGAKLQRCRHQASRKCRGSDRPRIAPPIDASRDKVSQLSSLIGMFGIVSQRTFANVSSSNRSRNGAAEEQ